ncbi:hypothetical protein IGI04_034403 [Brassica rapa subsp. trilocularis]|uniref:Secreted protein n=1 Tax=Brassica rapa subsp. trilocularis TaxID=1813537 RepID=A0ABQ7LBV6_BRACM|nr:hypothetical protein IGI04_034403 [Brassica rapa subsp. trilocularis]
MTSGFSPGLSRFQFLLRFLGSLVPINFRVISTASSLRRPVSGVSGGSAASCFGDDSPVVVSMAWSHVGVYLGTVLDGSLRWNSLVMKTVRCFVQVCSGETSGRSSSFPANLGVWSTDMVIG